jgi:hypothetical protein
MRIATTAHALLKSGTIIERAPLPAGAGGHLETK